MYIIEPVLLFYSDFKFVLYVHLFAFLCCSELSGPPYIALEILLSTFKFNHMLSTNQVIILDKSFEFLSALRPKSYRNNTLNFFYIF